MDRPLPLVRRTRIHCRDLAAAAEVEEAVHLHPPVVVAVEEAVEVLRRMVVVKAEAAAPKFAVKEVGAVLRIAVTVVEEVRSRLEEKVVLELLLVVELAPVAKPRRVTVARQKQGLWVLMLMEAGEGLRHGVEVEAPGP